ncbi:MAG: 3-dehydroquinate synthase [Cytophagaceae bacterium]
MKLFQQEFKVSYSYPVYFTEDIFQKDNPVFFDVINSDAPGNIKLLFVVDSEVDRLQPYLKSKLADYIKGRQGPRIIDYNYIVIPGGEECKNDTKYLFQIINAIDESHLCRHSYIVGIGGGAVLDVTGFAAAIAHRGIRHIRIPTTVLSMDDSGVGVKNGINLYSKKNYLGTFVPPSAVIIDPSFISTLPYKELIAGISEAIKVALVKDKEFFNFIKLNINGIIKLNRKVLDEVIYKSAVLHLNHISSDDPFEKGTKRPLDFGHWAAHKIEQLSGFRISHGNAVAAGIALDSTISLLLGNLSKEEWLDIIQLLASLNYTLYFEEMAAEEENGGIASSLIFGLEEFREHLGGELTITMLNGIGNGFEIHRLPEDIIIRSVKILYNLQLKYDREKRISSYVLH